MSMGRMPPWHFRPSATTAVRRPITVRLPHSPTSRGGRRRTGGLRLSRGFGWAALYRRRRAVLTLTAARVISDTTRRRPARRVPPEVEAGALKAVLGVLADGAGVAASTDPSGVGDGV